MTAVRQAAHLHLRVVRNAAPRLKPAAVPLTAHPQVQCTGAPLPLFHRPSQVVLLSPDAELLATLGRTLPNAWSVRAFQCPRKGLNFLQQEPPRWEADLWAQQEVISQWHCGSPLIPLVLRYWAHSRQRHRFSGVTIGDGDGAGTGMDALSELVDWPGHKILLHGESAGRMSFDRSIDGVVARASDSMPSDLRDMAATLLATPNVRHQQIWYSTLKPAHLGTLRRPSVAADLHAYLRTTFAEWIFIGEPFGAVCLDHQGAPHWLQLESEAELEELADIALEAGMGESDARDVRCGRKLSNQELRGALRMSGADAVDAFQVGDAPGVLAASMRIEHPPYTSVATDGIPFEGHALAFTRSSRVSPVSAAG